MTYSLVYSLVIQFWPNAYYYSIKIVPGRTIGSKFGKIFIFLIFTCCLPWTHASGSGGPLSIFFFLLNFNFSKKRELVCNMDYVFLFFKHHIYRFINNTKPEPSSQINMNESTQQCQDTCWFTSCRLPKNQQNQCVLMPKNTLPRNKVYHFWLMS